MNDKIDALIQSHDQGRFEDVIARGPALAAAFPEAAAIPLVMGNAHRKLGQPDKAIPCFERVLVLEPGHAGAQRQLAGALNDAGALLRRRGKIADAVGLYRRALAIDPAEPGFLYNLGNALGDIGRPDEAMASYRQALRIKPDFADAHLNLGNQLRGLHRLDEAVSCYGNALRIRPDHADTLAHLGIALAAQRRFDRAIASYRRAIEIRPDHLAAHYNLGNLLVQMERREEAIASFEAALRIEPGFAAARAKKLHQQALIGDWEAIEAERAAIARLGIEGDVVTPFSMLAFEDDPARHRIRSERFVAKRFPQPELGPIAPPPARPEKLRIGYFSADFCDHATMHLLARLFELHDRTRFAVHAYSYTLNPNDAMRQRLKQSFDGFHDVSGLTDRAIAEKARTDGIDIAIDLTGHTSRNRAAIFAFRAAPIQINYLGYPGTMGASFIDYMIADRRLIPLEERPHYREKIITLPDQYQVQDDRLAISPNGPARIELGLPEQGFVFCAINNSYKIGPAEFAIWMRLLQRVEGSVLWMLRSDGSFEANIVRRAASHGIDPARMVFFDRIGIHDYLARLGRADLFLDTFTYNAGATASHALWAGLPVVTKMGRGYTARMAGSLLHAIDLPELIATTEQHYEELAFALATQPQRLAEIRDRLGANRATKPLFDTERFTRHIELAYHHAYQRHFEGREPADIDLSEAGPG